METEAGCSRTQTPLQELCGEHTALPHTRPQRRSAGRGPSTWTLALVLLPPCSPGGAPGTGSSRAAPPPPHHTSRPPETHRFLQSRAYYE